MILAIGPCVGCGRTFFFDPDLVPSLRWQGARRPICRDCVARVNPTREANGLEPIRPLPGAYGPEDGEGDRHGGT